MPARSVPGARALASAPPHLLPAPPNRRPVQPALLVRAGATVMFSETTEVRDGIDQLTSRAVNEEIANAMIREMAWYDACFGRGQADRSANTTPGNKAGDLSNIVEKAMGSIVKSGSAPISGVLAPGEKLKPAQRGLGAVPPDARCGQRAQADRG